MSVTETLPLFRLDDAKILGERNVWEIALTHAYLYEMQIASMNSEVEPNDLISGARNRLNRPFPGEVLGEKLNGYAYTLAYRLNAHQYEKDPTGGEDEPPHVQGFKAIIPEVAAINGLSITAARIQNHIESDKVHSYGIEGEQS